MSGITNVAAIADIEVDGATLVELVVIHWVHALICAGQPVT